MNLNILTLELEKEHSDYVENIIEHFPLFENRADVFKLDFNKSTFTFFEKYLYDVYKLNISQYKIQDNNNHIVTFSIKKYVELTNIHYIKDELSSLVKNQNEPILTSITYFNRSYNPFLYTNISKKEIDNNSDSIKDSEKIFSSLLYWHDKHDHIIFDKNNFQGEINIEENKNQSVFYNNSCLEGCNCNSKKFAIYMTIWDEQNIPLVPVFNNDYISYKNIESQFLLKECNEDKENTIFQKEINNILNKDNSNYKLNSDSLIKYNYKNIQLVEYNCNFDYHYYKKLIFDKDSKAFNIFSSINDYDIINKENKGRYQITLRDYNNAFLLKSNTNNSSDNLIKINDLDCICNHYLDVKSKVEFKLCDYLLKLVPLKKNMYYEYPIFDIVNVKAEKNDISKLIMCIEKNSINGLNYLLDANESKFNIINKLVFEICNYYLKLLNIPFNSDIIIKCQLKNSHYKTNFSSNNGQVPFFTNILYLNYSEYDYTMATNLTRSDIKFKNSKNKMISFLKPSFLKLISLFGGYHFNTNLIHDNSNVKMLEINYFYKKSFLFASFKSDKLKNVEKEYNKHENLFSFEKNNKPKRILYDQELLDSITKKVLNNDINYTSYEELFNSTNLNSDLIFYSFERKKVNSKQVCFKIPDSSDSKKRRIKKKIQNKSINRTKNNNESIQMVVPQKKEQYENITLFNNYLKESQLLFLNNYVQYIDNWNNIEDVYFKKEIDIVNFSQEMQRTLFDILIIEILKIIESDNKLNITDIKIIKDVDFEKFGKISQDNYNVVFVPLLNKNDTKITLKNSYVYNILFQSFFVLTGIIDFKIQSNNMFLRIEYTKEESI